MRWMKCWATTARRASLKFVVSSAAFSLLAIALLAGTARSQETLHTQANIVLVPALVKDAQGGIVYGLAARDFVIEDDGVPQPVHLDESPEGQAISLVVVIQRGRRANYEFPRMQGLNSMLGPLFALGTARIALVEFDNAAELTRDFTKDPGLIAADLESLQPGNNGAPILDAVNYAIHLLQQEPPERQRVLLLISETRDHGSHVKIEDAVAAIGQSNTSIYALAFSPALSNILDTARGNNKNEEHQGIDFLDLGYRIAQAMRKNVPSTVAAMTGGEYQLFATRKKFDVRMNDFDNHLHSRYLLSIAPGNPHPGLHQIRVRLNNAGGNDVLARTTYWAESAK
jgi:VWFA-related protein